MTQEHRTSAKTTTGKPFVDRHLWEIQPIRDVAVIALAILLIQLGHMMRVVTVPLLLGLLFAYLFEPLVARVAKRTGRSLAAIIVLLSAYLVIGVPALVGIGLGAVQGVNLVEEVRRDWPAVERKLEDTLRKGEQLLESTGLVTLAEPEPEAPAEGAPGATPPEGSGRAGTTGEPAQGATEGASRSGSPEPGAAATPTNNTNGAKPAPPTDARPGTEAADRSELARLFDAARAYISGTEREIGRSIVGGGVAALSLGMRVLGAIGLFAFNVFFLIPFFFYFCSVGLDRVQRFGVSVIPKQKRDNALRLLRKMDRVISAFIRGRVTISVILSALFTLGFTLAGVPASFILGPITGLFAFVPYLGLIGWFAAMIMLGVTQAADPNPMAWWWIILGPTIAYWACQWIDDYILTPLIQGKQTGLDTPLILISVLGAAAIGGVYGVLVAIPVAACVKILVTDVFWPRYRAWAEGRAADPLPIGDGSGEKGKG